MPQVTLSRYADQPHTLALEHDGMSCGRAAREVAAVREIVAIWYRGASYQIGRGRDFYGIWPAGEPVSQPVERWPLTREGWYGAWARFTAIEAPGTIVPASPPAATMSGPSAATSPGPQPAAPAGPSGPTSPGAPPTVPPRPPIAMPGGP